MNTQNKLIGMHVGTRPFRTMRIVFGILSFCMAALLSFWLVPIVHQVVLPYLLHGPGVPFSLMQIGSVHLYEGHICVIAAVVASLVLALIITGVYAFRSRHTTA